MAAPDATLLAALRSTARPARHLFFKMGHSQGTVRAWDGLGDRIFDGETYTGIGNMASIAGVSNSRDLQTQEIVVTLNGVPYPALQSIDPSIRNETATITAAWYSYTGTLLASKVIFTGLGNFLTSAFSERTLSLTCHLRGRMADWSRAPQSFYTTADQSRYYPGDTGFDYVKTLENTTVSGWGLYAESTGGSVKHVSTFGRYIYDSLQTRAIGNDESGCFYYFDTAVRSAGYSTAVSSETTATSVTLGASDWQVSSANLYVDIDGYVRTAVGEYVKRSGAGTTGRYRAITEVASQGTATATTFSVSNTYACVTGSTLTSFSANPSSWKNGMFLNGGGLVTETAGVLYGGYRGAAGVAMVEETTGNAVTVTGGLVKCNGSNVFLSTTNVVLTSSNKRIYPTGTDVNASFARIWT